MSIGIYDMDLDTYTFVPYNLEAMKISAYYKRKREIVILSPSLTPERHEKFFIRKDYDDGNFPTKSLLLPNVEYGGLAFSNNVYKPLPIEIEKMRPDTTLYERMEKRIKYTDQKNQAIRDKIYLNLSTGEHMRLSLDGKTVWPEYGRQFKNLQGARDLIIHDYDLGHVEGALSEVKSIMARARNDGWATRLGMKFPVSIYTGEDLLGWTSLKPNSTFYSLCYKGLIPPKEFYIYAGSCKEQAAYSQMEYYVDYGCSDEDDFVKNRLRQIFRQVIIARSYRSFFSLKYSENFFKNKEWEKVIQLFNAFLHSMKTLTQARYFRIIADDSMYKFACSFSERPSDWYIHKIFTISEVREIFNFVRENYYPLFQDFYECTFNTIQEEIKCRDLK